MPRFFAPQPGKVWNPLRNIRPNQPCVCGSDEKFKNCCRNKIPSCVPPEEAARNHDFVLVREGKMTVERFLSLYPKEAEIKKPKDD